MAALFFLLWKRAAKTWKCQQILPSPAEHGEGTAYTPPLHPPHPATCSVWALLPLRWTHSHLGTELPASCRLITTAQVSRRCFTASLSKAWVNTFKKKEVHHEIFFCKTKKLLDPSWVTAIKRRQFPLQDVFERNHWVFIQKAFPRYLINAGFFYEKDLITLKQLTQISDFPVDSLNWMNYYWHHSIDYFLQTFFSNQGGCGVRKRRAVLQHWMHNPEPAVLTKSWLLVAWSNQGLWVTKNNVSWKGTPGGHLAQIPSQRMANLHQVANFGKKRWG